MITQDHAFSPSQINKYLQCPLSWKYSVERVPRIRISNDAARAGSVIHNSIARYFTVISDKPNLGSIEGTFQGILDEDWKKNGLPYMPRRQKCFDNFVKFEKTRARTQTTYKPTLIESNLQATINGMNFNTIIDCYWEDSGTIIDWKTGKLNQITTSEIIQGQVEKMVLESHGYKVNKVIFVGLMMGFTLQMPSSTNTHIETIVTQIFKSVTDNRFDKKRNQFCPWCEHQIRCDLEGRCLWQ